jgi:hypothetical protein
MAQTYQAHALTTDDDAIDSAPIAIKPFLISCAICSVLGLTVLAVLAQALVSFLAPVA